MSTEYPRVRTSQQVLKAEGDGPDATDRDCSANASPLGGAMGAEQPAAAGLDECDVCHGTGAVEVWHDNGSDTMTTRGTFLLEPCLQCGGRGYLGAKAA